MAIEFRCGACGTQFTVDEKLAGRKGRCKSCGQVAVIPRLEAAAATAAPAPRGAATGFQLAPIGAVAPGSPRKPAPVPAGRPMTWVDAVTSQVALAPVTAEGMRPVQKPFLASALDDASFSGLYRVKSMPDLAPAPGVGGRPAGAVTRGYRKELGSIQKLFRWLNESAYLISVPFLLLILLGIILHNRPLALAGATGAVLLNLTRVVTGIANLAVIPFRDSPIQGILFLIPPITFFYIWQNWKRVRKPTMRVIGPVLTIALVVVAFSFIPWLRAGDPPGGSVQDRLRSGAAELGSGIRDKVDSLPNVDTEELRAKAAGALESAKDRMGGPAPAAPNR